MTKHQYHLFYQLIKSLDYVPLLCCSFWWKNRIYSCKSTVYKVKLSKYFSTYSLQQVFKIVLVMSVFHNINTRVTKLQKLYKQYYNYLIWTSCHLIIEGCMKTAGSLRIVSRLQCRIWILFLLCKKKKNMSYIIWRKSK